MHYALFIQLVLICHIPSLASTHVVFPIDHCCHRLTQLHLDVVTGFLPPVHFDFGYLRVQVLLQRDFGKLQILGRILNSKRSLLKIVECCWQQGKLSLDIKRGVDPMLRSDYRLLLLICLYGIYIGKHLFEIFND